MPPELIMLRTSERSQFKRCRQAWWWAFVDHLKPLNERPALRFGTLVHAALEQRYPPGKKRGPHPAEVFKKLYDEELERESKMGFRDEDDVWLEAGVLGVSMLENFVETYGEDERWEVIASELPFQVTLHKTARFHVMYTGIIDGVWRDRENGDLWINDWKTAKSINVKGLPLNEQAGAYWGFGPVYLRQQKIIKPKDTLKGIQFTYLRKAMKDDRPTDDQGRHLNNDGTISKRQPAPYFVRQPTRRNEHQSEMLRGRALEEAKEMMKVRLGKMHIGKSPSDWNCGVCQYTDMCELHEAGLDWESFRDATMKVWDPYEEHEIQRAELR